MGWGVRIRVRAEEGSGAPHSGGSRTLPLRMSLSHRAGSWLRSGEPESNACPHTCPELHRAELWHHGQKAPQSQAQSWPSGSVTTDPRHSLSTAEGPHSPPQKLSLCAHEGGSRGLGLPVREEAGLLPTPTLGAEEPGGDLERLQGLGADVLQLDEQLLRLSVEQLHGYIRGHLIPRGRLQRVRGPRGEGRDPGAPAGAQGPGQRWGRWPCRWPPESCLRPTGPTAPLGGSQLSAHLGRDVLTCSRGSAGMTSTDEPLPFSPGSASSRQSLNTPNTVVW